MLKIYVGEHYKKYHEKYKESLIIWIKIKLLFKYHNPYQVYC